MKKLLLFALMVGMTVCYTSCGSDDDDAEPAGMGNTVVGNTDAQAAHYAIKTNAAPTATTENGQEVSLTGFNVTEYEQAVIEIDVDGAKKYKTYDVTVKDNVYTLYDKNTLVGTVEKVTTHAVSNVELVFKLNVSIEIDGQTVPVQFDGSTAAEETTQTSVSTITSQLTNTWAVERMKLVLEFDDKSKADASTTTQGGDLRPFIDLAKKNGVKINEQDEEDLTRTIESIIIDKGNLFVIKYADGRSDAATWSWTSQKEDSYAIGIKLKDDDMGNKFFNDDSKIAVVFRSGNKINLTMQTRLEDDDCTASLIVNLK